MSVTSDECKAMERPKAEGFRVVESVRAVVRCQYLSADESGRGSRIRVKRWDSKGWTPRRDSNAVTVPWDHALNTSENFAEAVRVYLRRAGWEGEWSVGLCDGGAVAVYVPGTAGVPF